MQENDKIEPFEDITGTTLTPSEQGCDCLGNGKHEEIGCCCDECGYFLYCYPQFDK